MRMAQKRTSPPKTRAQMPATKAYSPPKIRNAKMGFSTSCILHQNPTEIFGHTVRGKSNMQFKGKATKTDVPETISGCPRMVFVHPGTVSGQTKMVLEYPEMPSGRPELISVHPEIVFGRTKVVSGRPEAVSGLLGSASGKNGGRTSRPAAHLTKQIGLPLYPESFRDCLDESQ